MSLKNINIKKFLKNILRIIILSLVSFYLLLIFAGFFFADRLLFPSPSASYSSNNSFKSLTLKSDSVIMMSEHFPPSKTPSYFIIYSHGNGVDLGDIQFKLKEASLYLNSYIISYDYPGYGQSTGSPTEQNVYKSVEAVYQYMLGKGIKSEKIIIWGRSVGSGPATYLAEKHKGHPLILESPFLTAFRVVTHYPVIPFDKFQNITRISNIDAPLLVIHGKKDKIIPFYHGFELYTTAKLPKKNIWFKDAGHNNITRLYRVSYPQIRAPVTSVQVVCRVLL
jgi:hypothetical protein